MSVCRCLWNHRSFFIILITPLVLLPIPLYITDQKGTCGYMLVLMGVYWCTEAMPLAVTGMIPIFLSPMFGFVTTDTVCNNYFKAIVMMFTGGLIVAVGVEKSNLHKRIALSVLKTIGTRPRSLMFGFMLPTWFLSMWISNTATTAMMIPIMEAVLEQLKLTQVTETKAEEIEGGRNSDEQASRENEVEMNNAVNGLVNPAYSSTGNLSNGVENQNKLAGLADLGNREKYVVHSESLTVETQETEEEISKKQKKQNQEFNNFCKAMTVAIAYSANVGGTATLNGTGPNTIMKGVADELWASQGFIESPVTYGSWIVYGFPVAVLNIIFVYVWLVLFYLGFRAFSCAKEDTVKRNAVKKVILKEYKALGPMRFDEVAMAVMFIILVLLWFFRAPGFIQGWASFFKTGYIKDAVPAIFIAVLLFAIPRQLPRCKSDQVSGRAQALLDWQSVHEKFPWSIIFLMGGGFALAEAAQQSKLSEWIGEQLVVFENLPDWLMVAVICLLVAMLTEVTSNSATCNILMPIMASLAESLNKNPLFLMLPTAISTSFAFMLPVATPPNAIAFSYGRISVFDMVKAGAILNILCVIGVTLANQTWGLAFFDLHELPWSTDSNATTVATI